MGKIKWIELVDKSIMDDKSKLIISIEAGNNCLKKIGFEFFHGVDSIVNVMKEFQEEFHVDNIDKVQQDMVTLISSRRIKRFEYD